MRGDEAHGPLFITRRKVIRGREVGGGEEGGGGGGFLHHHQIVWGEGGEGRALPSSHPRNATEISDEAEANKR